MTKRPLAHHPKRESEKTVSWQSAMPCRLPPMTFQTRGFLESASGRTRAAHIQTSVGEGGSIAERQLRVAVDNCYL